LIILIGHWDGMLWYGSKCVVLVWTFWCGFTWCSYCS